jgi:hypothetical protein
MPAALRLGPGSFVLLQHKGFQPRTAMRLDLVQHVQMLLHGLL